MTRLDDLINENARLQAELTDPFTSETRKKEINRRLARINKEIKRERRRNTAAGDGTTVAPGVGGAEPPPVGNAGAGGRRRRWVRDFGSILRGNRGIDFGEAGQGYSQAKSDVQRGAQRAGRRTRLYYLRTFFVGRNLGVILLFFLAITAVLFALYFLAGGFFNLIVGLLLVCFTLLFLYYGLASYRTDKAISILFLFLSLLSAGFSLWFLGFFSITFVFIASLILGGFFVLNSNLKGTYKILIIIGLLALAFILYSGSAFFIVAGQFIGTFSAYFTQGILIVLIIASVIAGYFIYRSRLSSKTKTTLYIFLGLLFIGFLFLPPLFTAGASTFVAALAATAWFRLIFAGIFIALSIYLFFKKDQKGNYPYRKFSIFLFILAILFAWLFESLYGLLALTGSDLFGLRLIVSLILGVLGLYLMFKTNAQGKHVNFGLGLFLIILGIAFWFVIPFVSSTLFEKYGLKGEIAVEEAGIGKRLARFWYYVQHPEEYFAEFGRFDNPQAKEKGPPVGIRIEKFEPVVDLFRTDQDVRLSAEVKHYGLPVLLDSKENKVKIKFLCFFNSTTGVITNGGLSFAGRSGFDPSDNGIEISRGVNGTYIVFCDFEKGKLTIEKGKDQTTKKITLSSGYENFVTESLLRVYTIGADQYQRLLARDNVDVEILQALRSAASYPGLVNNERKTISEYSVGPVELGVSIVNEQPIVSGNQYTLIVSSRPNSVVWEGNIKSKDIFMEVPTWFTISDSCSFEEGSLGVPFEQTQNTKELILTESAKRSVDRCAEQKGCRYWCDFTVDGEFENIEEYVLRAFQQTDYTITKSTTFDYILVPGTDVGSGIVTTGTTTSGSSGTSTSGGSASSGSMASNTGTSTEPKPQCSDGIDNDNDGKKDDEDPGCIIGGQYDPNRNNETEPTA